MTMFSTFPGPSVAESGDILVGLRSGANRQFHAESFLFAADNLSDLADLAAALGNLGLSDSDDVTFETVTANTSVTAPAIVGSSTVTSPSFISSALNVNSAINAITAHSGGGQGSAVALTKAISRVTIVAASGDSVKLPAALAGLSMALINAAASNPLDCYPASGEVINALSANSPLVIAANKTVLFFCAVNGIWDSIVTA